MTSTSSCCALYPCSISIFSGSLKPTVQLFVSLTKNPRKQAVFPAKLYEFMESNLCLSLGQKLNQFFHFFRVSITRDRVRSPTAR